MGESGIVVVSPSVSTWLRIMIMVHPLLSSPQLPSCHSILITIIKYNSIIIKIKGRYDMIWLIWFSLPQSQSWEGRRRSHSSVSINLESVKYEASTLLLASLSLFLPATPSASTFPFGFFFSFLFLMYGFCFLVNALLLSAFWCTPGYNFSCSFGETSRSSLVMDFGLLLEWHSMLNGLHSIHKFSYGPPQFCTAFAPFRFYLLSLSSVLVLDLICMHRQCKIILHFHPIIFFHLYDFWSSKSEGHAYLLMWQYIIGWQRKTQCIQIYIIYLYKFYKI